MTYDEYKEHINTTKMAFMRFVIEQKLVLLPMQNQFTDNKYPYWKKMLKIWRLAV